MTIVGLDRAVADDVNSTVKAMRRESAMRAGPWHALADERGTLLGVWLACGLPAAGSTALSSQRTPLASARRPIYFGRLERLDRPTPAESAPSGALGHQDWACRGSRMAARALRLQPCCGARKTLK